MRKIIYILIIFIFVFLCIEIFCRLFGIGKIFYINDNASIYQYDKNLGWSLVPNVNKNFEIMVHIQTNSMGFRDIEHNYSNKIKKRIMFIGDSFTFGDKINQNDIFVEQLRNKLTNYEIFNCGVSGYGTDQEYLLLQKYYDILNPDVVFLMVCFNDPVENVCNYIPQGYYRPLFIRKGNDIFLYKNTVPHSYHCYRNNILIRNSNFLTFLLQQFIILKNPIVITDDYGIIEHILLLFKQYLYQKKCLFYIGLTNHDEKLETFFKNNDIKYVVVENSNIIENDIHWNEKGHEYAADKIYKFFKEENII